ncbi:MAG: hypothetical protein R2690_06825 [Acidimicrobiales bacterium]
MGAVIADAFWDRGVFKGGRLGTVWYYHAMAEIVGATSQDSRSSRRCTARRIELAQRCAAGREHGGPADERHR